MSVASEAPARAATPGDGAVTTGQRSPARWIVVAIVLVIAAGIILRFLTFSELWLDEALSVNISRLPLRDIPQWLRHDGAPPLYYFVLHVWTGVFGTSDFAVRSLSGIISVATIPPMWFAGRRIAGRAGAWIAVLLTAASPFAIQFATETRMYSIQMLLVTLGYLALYRLLERPSLGRQAVVALLAGLLLYSQYWSLYLLAVVGVVLVVQAWRGRSPDARHAARAGVVALIAGGITFLPWIPTFLYQSAHTGTPWGDPVLPTAAFAFTVRDFSGGEHSEAYVLLFLLLALTVVALFGKAVDRYRIELDVRTHPGVRVEAGVWIAALLLGGVAGLLARATFASRYASVVWPLFILVVVYGITVFTSFRVRAVIVAIVVAIGLVGGVRNVVGDKTQAKEVADAIKAHAKPGDVVLYCPDQLGPSTSRLLEGRRGLKQLTFPFGDSPELVDWVDYKQRRDKVDAHAFAQSVSDKAAPGRTIWYVIATQYRGGNEGKCDAVQRELAGIRGTNPRLLVEPDDKFSEFLGLLEYPAR
jgi:hypothetical protein